ncbi:DUF2318 domain-containing protein [Desulfosporosinus sp.]|uniref:DUF2318 domain-containing protein n=1 Tax=Desulfosporosinus sp. TaxID=157907 RepID=UPI0025C46B93|nr:DUF2318 domain-containing protein [Desulfosporosinus sp.]MBC2723615.1 DUF2318 domain-containing protein [Desulfosporosinus sp.]MBC2728389.1 DUF2318 domain-containing protein [Desulfosporosinus sp.]
MKNDHIEKNQKFTQPHKNNTLLYSIVGLLTVVIMIGTYFMVAGSNSPNASVTAAADIGETISYSPTDKLEQTNVENKVENGKAIVTTLSTVKEKKFIWTEYKANGKRIPLTAFAQPDGKVMVAVSFCEPCRGETFHIIGNQIVCNACGTTWDLQTLKGLSGGCQAYPPEALTYTLNGDNLEIPQSVLDAWEPRV